MKRGARFSNGMTASPGISLTYARAYATVNGAGQAIAANAPYYEVESATAGAPTVVQLSSNGTTSGANSVVGSGTWSDGTPCSVQYYETAAATPRYVAIRVNSALTANLWDTFTGLPTAEQARIKDIGYASNGHDLLKGSGAAYGEDSAAFRHRPGAGVVDRGRIIVIGDANVPGSSTMPYAHMCTWNDSASRWELLYRSPAFNTSNTGKWNNWNRPHICHTSATPSTALEAWLCYNTYDVDNASNTVAGTVMLARLYRSVASDPFSVDAVIELLRPDYDTTADGGGTGTHIHDCLVMPWGSGIAVVVSVGHGTTHSVHVIYRSDTNYTQGWSPTDPGSGQVYRSTPTLGANTLCNPSAITPTASKVNGTTQNGWTTRRYAAGDLTTYAAGTANALINPQWMTLDRIADTARFLALSDESAGPAYTVSMPAVDTDKLIPVRANDTGYNSFRGGWVCWGISRPDQTVYSGYAAIRAPDNITPTTVPNLGGTTWTNRNAASKLMYSGDGVNWAEIYHLYDATDKRFVLGWHGPTKCIVGVKTGSAIVLRCITVPTVTSGLPLAVSPLCVNYAQDTVSLGSTGGTNTITDVTATYQSAGAISTGRTIPPCPSNGRVLRCTGNNSSNAICAEVRPTGAATKTIPLASDKVRVGFWLYTLPTRTGWTSNSTPPYNGYDGPYFGIRFEDSSGSPITGQLNADSMNGVGGGWNYYTFEFDIDTTTQLSAAMAVGPVRFYLRLQTTGAIGAYADFLLCCDHLVAGSTSEFPTIPPPCGSSATTTEQCTASIDGFSPGANWSAALRLQVSQRGWDSYTLPAYRVANRRLFTLVQTGSPSRYISCTVDTTNGRLTFTDGTTSAVISATSGEFFEFNRRSPINIGITKTDAGGGNSTMAFYVSVGGTQIGTTLVSGSLTWNTSDVRPVRCVLSDPAVAPCDGILCHAVSIDESAALSASDMATFMQTAESLGPPTTASVFVLAD